MGERNLSDVAAAESPYCWDCDGGTVMGRRLVWPSVLLLALAVACSSAEVEDGRPGGVIPSRNNATSGEITMGSAAISQSTSLTTDSSDEPPVDLVDNYLMDIESYWAATLPELFNAEMRPVRDAVGYTPSESAQLPDCNGVQLSADSAAGNAFYCRDENVIVYDAEDLVPSMVERFGRYAVGVLLAHEYGHAVQAQIGIVDASLPLELQADCFAGAWAQTRVTGEPEQAGIVQALLQSARDADGDAIAEHGTGFDRVQAYSRGWGQGAAGCVPASQFTEVQQESAVIDEAGPVLNPTRDLESLISTLVARLQIDSSVKVVLLSAAGEQLHCNGSHAADDFYDLAMACSSGQQVVVDDAGLLTRMWRDEGDLAAGYVLARTYFEAEGVGAGDETWVESVAECRTGAFFAELTQAEGTDIAFFATELDEVVAGVVGYLPRRADFGSGPPAPISQRLISLFQGYNFGDEVCE